MSNLVPEVRINKLGVPVTKRVRAWPRVVGKNVPVPNIKDNGTSDVHLLAATLSSLIFTVRQDNSDPEFVSLVDAHGKDDGNEYRLKYVQEALVTLMGNHNIRHAVDIALAKEEFTSLEVRIIGEQFYDFVLDFAGDLEAGERTQTPEREASMRMTDSILLAATASGFTLKDGIEMRVALRDIGKASRRFQAQGAYGFNVDEPEYREALTFAYLLSTLTDAPLPTWVHKDEVLDVSLERNIELRARISEVNESIDLVAKHQDVCRDRRSIDIGLLTEINSSSTPALRSGML